MGKQYLDTGWFGILVVLTIAAFILVNIARAGKGKELFIRRISGLDNIDEAVGRATEMGKPVMMVPGISSPFNAKAMQAINIFGYIARVASKFANPILVCCGTATIYTVAQEVISDVYQQEGLEDQYDVDSVRFISDQQFAFAAGVAGLMMREQVAACFLMGEFYAESLIFAETANSVGAIQVASSTELTQIPFFVAACDYVLIGDEFYAASAYLTRQPVLTGSLIGQDWSKVLLILFIVVGAVWGGVAARGTTTQEWSSGNYKTIPERPVKVSDTLPSRLLNPDAPDDKDIKFPERPKYNPNEIPKPVSSASGGGGA